jgi:hypothetical protein
MNELVHRLQVTISDTSKTIPHVILPSYAYADTINSVVCKCAFFSIVLRTPEKCFDHYITISRQSAYYHKDKNKPTSPLTLNQVNSEARDCLRTEQSNFCAGYAIDYVCALSARQRGCMNYNTSLWHG